MKTDDASNSNQKFWLDSKFTFIDGENSNAI